MDVLQTHYSERFVTATHEYRIVILPSALRPFVNFQNAYLAQHEWRSLGIQQVRCII